MQHPDGGVNVAIGVSILTRPGGRVQQLVTAINELPIQVSILTRPGGRVQLGHAHALVKRLHGFNPHPTRRPGATTGGVRLRNGELVSILTRPGGRVQL